MQDSFTTFVDHFILLHAARFIDASPSCPTVTHSNACSTGSATGASADNELEETWALIAASVQDMLGKPRTPDERARLAHVDPSQYTPAVCRARVRYMLWKMNAARTPADTAASHVGATTERGSALHEHSSASHHEEQAATADATSWEMTPLHEGVPSSFDVTKHSLKRNIDAIYAAVRARLPSALDPCASDCTSEASSNDVESNTPCACDAAGARHHHATPGRARRSRSREADGVCNVTAPASLSVGAAMTAPNGQLDVCAPHTASSSTIDSHTLQHGRHRGGVDSGANGILHVHIPSALDAARECEMAAARNELLRKVHEWQAEYYARVRRWVDVPESVLQLSMGGLSGHTETSVEAPSGHGARTGLIAAGHGTQHNLPASNHVKGGAEDAQREELLRALRDDLMKPAPTTLRSGYPLGGHGCAEGAPRRAGDALCHDSGRGGAPEGATEPPSMCTAASRLSRPAGQEDIATRRCCLRDRMKCAAVLPTTGCVGGGVAAVEEVAVAADVVGHTTAAADEQVLMHSAARPKRCQVIEYSEDSADDDYSSSASD